MINNLENITGIQDFIVTPIYFTFMMLFIRRQQKKHEQEFPYYRYYTKGFLLKILASLTFCFIYIFYYDGGDTTDYFWNSKVLANMMTENFGHFFKILIGNYTDSDYSFFNNNTNYPLVYMWHNKDTFIVSRLTSLITFFCFKSYFATSITLAFISYMGCWKLFKFFMHYYHHIEKPLAIATLFIPSVLFWGSGIMKDTYTYAATCWFIYSIHQVFFSKNQRTTNIITSLIMASVIIGIKPYIFVALLPGTLFWVFHGQLQKINNLLIRSLTIPFILIVFLAVLSTLLSGLSEKLGDYGSYDSIIKKAQTTQEDLKRAELYGKNYYDLGTIDPSFGGMMRMAPKAFIAGLYRPFIWEARSVTIFISGLENLILLYLTITILIRSGIRKFITTLFIDPVLLFSFVFSSFFLFSVGLSTANFGALVRYKIPAMPFFVATLFVLNYHYLRKERVDYLKQYQEQKKKFEENAKKQYS